MDYDALMHECLERESLKRPTMEDVRYRYNYHAHPFNTGLLPLQYSGNPGVTGASYRGASSSAWRR